MLKAIFLEFNAVLIKDADIRRSLIDELLVAENLRPDPQEYPALYRGNSDRTCLSQLLTRRGRVVNSAYLEKLLAQKATRYIQILQAQGKLPLYPGLEDFLYQIKRAALPLCLLTTAHSAEVDWVLTQAHLKDQFAAIVTGDNLPPEAEKPSPLAYQTALKILNETLGQRDVILPEQCLAVEATYAGIQSARSAGVPVVGVAHLYPYWMIQRRANWAVDYLNEIDLDWIQPQYSPTSGSSTNAASSPEIILREVQ